MHIIHATLNDAERDALATVINNTRANLENQRDMLRTTETEKSMYENLLNVLHTLRDKLGV